MLLLFENCSYHQGQLMLLGKQGIDLISLIMHNQNCREQLHANTQLNNLQFGIFPCKRAVFKQNLKKIQI